MATFTDLFARLDPDPRVRGKQFEHVCKWFLTNDPTYKNTLRKVWLWSEWTGRWGGDAGIDLVAEDHDGRLWAIQAKAYAPENTVTKADVDKFLSESSRGLPNLVPFARDDALLRAVRSLISSRSNSAMLASTAMTMRPAAVDESMSSVVEARVTLRGRPMGLRQTLMSGVCASRGGSQRLQAPLRNQKNSPRR